MWVICVQEGISLPVIFQKLIFVVQETQAHYVQMVGDGWIFMPIDRCQ